MEKREETKKVLLGAKGKGCGRSVGRKTCVLRRGRPEGLTRWAWARLVR